MGRLKQEDSYKVNPAPNRAGGTSTDESKRRRP